LEIRFYNINYFLSVLYYILITISFIDLEHMIIPDGLVLAAALLGLMALIFNILPIGWPESAYGALLYGGGLALAGYAGKLIYKMETMGWGDVKLALVMGLCLGWIMSIVSLVPVGSYCDLLYCAGHGGRPADQKTDDTIRAVPRPGNSNLILVGDRNFGFVFTISVINSMYS
jgi:prepilin signal peptidase PulO-like enzyme (type II secretory pathway)